MIYTPAQVITLIMPDVNSLCAKSTRYRKDAKQRLKTTIIMLRFRLTTFYHVVSNTSKTKKQVDIRSINT